MEPLLIALWLSENAGEISSDNLQVVNDLHPFGFRVLLRIPSEIIFKAELRTVRAVPVVKPAFGVFFTASLRARNRV